MKNCTMSKPPVVINENLRVQSLHDLQILDTPEEDEYTNIVLVTAAVCNTPIATISLLDTSRQWFKAKTGLTEIQTDRDISFCGHAIAQDNKFFQVEDTLKDTRFYDNPMVVSGPKIRFYAGVQLFSRMGYKIGMLCVNDTKPNALTDQQIFTLQVLANAVSKLLELRFIHKQSEEKTRKIEAHARTQEMLLHMMAHDSQLYHNNRGK
jgi:GAF domain-containing protein